jgi:hypothetical protein
MIYRGRCFEWKSLAAIILLLTAGRLFAADEQASSDIVVMERVLVEATKAHDFGPHTRWLYVALPDCEILSLTDSEVTLGAAQHFASLMNIDRQFIPARYLSPVTVPSSLIMFDHPTSAAMDALIPSTIEVVDGSAFGEYDSHRTTIGGIDTADWDTHCVAQNRSGQRWPWAGGALGRGPVPTGLLFQLSRTNPALPLWYQYGFVGPCGFLRFTFVKDGAVIACASWVSQAQTDLILDRWKKFSKTPVYPPISILFNVRAPDVRDAATIWPSSEWMAEAALFLRWGLYGANAPKETGRPYTDPIKHRHAFDAFVERSRTEVVTEARFKECFGYGYTEAQSRMERYFIDAARKPIIVPYELLTKGSHDPMQITYRNVEVEIASDDEIARILGDWERMQAYSLRISKPEISRMYLRQAGKTLHKAYDAGERDPRFLAVLGLYDLDTGANAQARLMLEEATKAGVNRPAAFIGLAKLNLDEALAQPGLAGANLSPTQLASVLKPLFAVRERTRLAAEDYRLAARAWLNSSVRPDQKNLEILREGICLYPFDEPLHSAAATCYSKWKYADEALAVIEHGLKTADESSRKELTDLEGSIRTKPN